MPNRVVLQKNLRSDVASAIRTVAESEEYNFILQSLVGMRQRLDSYHDMRVGMVLPSKLQEHINYSTQVQSPSLVISDLDCSGSSVVPTVRPFQQHHNAWPPQPSQA